MKRDDHDFIRGAGGGGDSHTPVSAPNTLKSKTTARVQFLVSRGEIGGLADQTNRLKSVYFNNSPVMNPDGSLNYKNVKVEERYGLPSQAPMQGFPAASNTVTLSQKVTTTSPQTYTASNDDVDALRVTMRFPALFQTEDNGDTNGTEVQFRIMRRVGAGSFSLFQTVTKRDKNISPADVDYLVPRPYGQTGLLAVRIERVTPDNDSEKKANDIYFQFATEIQNATTADERERIRYNGFAYVGLTVTSETTGSSFPTVAFDMNLRKVKVPSNYNVALRAHGGAWDGTFKPTKEVCDNPAWVLYDLLTDPEGGMGSVISEDDVDKWSFYDAAVYNDGMVPAVKDGSYTGQNEPRFTFNYQFMEAMDAWTLIQNVAATFGAAVYGSGTRVKLVQDRPTGFSRIVTNSNVIDGMFERLSTSRSSKYTACIVNWNDPNQNMLSVPCYYEDETASASHLGLRVKEVTALGVTNEGQALRLAKWHVETSLRNTETVSFQVGWANAGFEPGDVFKLMDTNYAQVSQEAKVVSATLNSVTLDRPIPVAAGNTFDVVGADGQTLYTRAIISSGTLSTIGFSGGAISVLPGADLVVTGAISPQLFKVITVKEEGEGKWSIVAAQYDPNKFGRVDNTPTGPSPIYQAPSTVPSVPLNLSFREIAVNDNNVIRHSLVVSWTRPAAGTVKYYVFAWRRGDGEWVQATVDSTTYTIENASSCTYEVQVFAKSVLNVPGPTATGSYDLTLGGGTLSPLAAPTNLGEFYTGTALFSDDDLYIKWTNPNTGLVGGKGLRDFEVRVIDPTDDAVLRIEYIALPTTGGAPTYTYSLTKNKEDGGPRRSVRIEVRARDTSNNLSAPATVTFNNPPPGIPSNVSLAANFGKNMISWRPPPDEDFAGILIWGSTDPAFKPSEATLLREATYENNWIHGDLTANTTYYYYIASFDSFGRDNTGATLILSSRLEIVTASQDFDINKLRNSSFENLQVRIAPGSEGIGNAINRPLGWLAMAGENDSVNVQYTASAGRNSTNAMGVRALEAGNGAFGIRSFPEDGGGVSGGWKLDKDYVVSVWARKGAGGADWAAIDLDHTDDYTPTVREVLLKPPLTTAWQRYAWHVRWPYFVPANGQVKFKVVKADGSNGSITVASEIRFDDVQVEEGDMLTAYAPRVGELGPGSIKETMIADDSVTSPKVVANSILGYHVQSDTMETRHFQANSVTADKVSINELSAITGNLGEIYTGYARGVTFAGGGYTQADDWPASPTASGFQLNNSGLKLGRRPIASGGTVDRFLLLSHDGNVYAPGLTIENGNLYLTGDISNGPVFISRDGDISAPGLSITNGNAVFSGLLQAAGGTFSGNLQAAGGTFTGTLVGVDGEFSGTVNIAEASIDTLKIAGEAATAIRTAAGSSAVISTTLTVPPGEVWKTVIIGVQNSLGGAGNWPYGAYNNYGLRLNVTGPGGGSRVVYGGTIVIAMSYGGESENPVYGFSTATVSQTFYLGAGDHDISLATGYADYYWWEGEDYFTPGGPAAGAYKSVVAIVSKR